MTGKRFALLAKLKREEEGKNEQARNVIA